MSRHYASATELARLFGWTETYVRKLASVHHWRRRGRNPVEYNLDDVGRYRATTRSPRHGR